MPRTNRPTVVELTALQKRAKKLSVDLEAARDRFDGNHGAWNALHAACVAVDSAEATLASAIYYRSQQERVAQ